MFRNIFHRAQGLDGTVSTAGTRLEKRPHVALGAFRVCSRMVCIRVHICCCYECNSHRLLKDFILFFKGSIGSLMATCLSFGVETIPKGLRKAPASFQPKPLGFYTFHLKPLHLTEILGVRYLHVHLNPLHVKAPTTL